jgi:peptidyl-prolyl cis-trans isomerase-like 4
LLYGDQARYFEAEKVPRMKHTKVGTLSMVNCGDGMVGSQFFVTLDENLTYLDSEHCIFGEVAEGFEVLGKINEAICDGSNRPYQDIRISHTVILEDPFEDPVGLSIPSRSPSPTPERMQVRT